MTKIKTTLLIIFTIFIIKVSNSQDTDTISSQIDPQFLEPAHDTSFANLSTINSPFDDYLPIFSDSILIFTSNRQNESEEHLSQSLKKNYSCKNINGNWDIPLSNDNKWNIDNNTSLIGFYSDNFYFYRSNKNNNGDLYTAKYQQKSEKSLNDLQITKIKNICTKFDENSIAHGKGDTIYFVSNKDGNYNIYMSKDGAKPVKVDSVNTEYDENDVFITEDGNNMFFSSNRPGGKGDYDIYQSFNEGNGWSSATLVDFPYINSENSDRDFRLYGDSTIFFSSNRSGGAGGMDIYLITLRTVSKQYMHKDTVQTVDSVAIEEPPKDSIHVIAQPEITIPEPSSVPIEEEIKPIVQNEIKPATQDTLKQEHDELIVKLKEFGLFPFKGEIQIGAYRMINSVDEFKKKFQCLRKEPIRMDTVTINGVLIHKFLINKTFTDIDESINKQLQIINKHCLPELNFSDMPFICLFDSNNNRFAIFWKKDESIGKNIFYIFQNGKQIWKGKRF